MAVITDPTGAAVGLWEPGTFGGAGIVNEHGALVWNELSTDDTDAAARFYAAVLPISPAPSQMPGVQAYTEFKVGGRAVAGMKDLSMVPDGVPPHWLPYFHVDDVDSIQATAVRAGGSVMAPAFDMAAGRMAVLADPQGGVFAVITASAPEQPA
ncbi:VOC family protein [Streptomyces sp. NPDC003038]|uniref:VOC family protein n=1 Tax=unclassified Streptomyces TaxID=2593676 RepID=UPI0033B37485